MIHSDKVRLFLAIDFLDDADLVKELNQFSDNFPHDAANMQFTSHYHLTFYFFGSLEQTMADEIIALFSDFKFSCFSISFDQVAQFSDAVSSSVFFLDVCSKPLQTLHARIEQMLKQYYTANTQFHPHVTLARCKEIKNSDLLQAYTTQFSVRKSYKVRKLQFIQSERKKGGTTYRTLAELSAQEGGC